METYEQELASKLAEAKRTRDYKVNKGIEEVKELFSGILTEKLEHALASRENSVIAYSNLNDLSSEAAKTLTKLSDEGELYGGGMYIPEVFKPYLDGFIVRYYTTSQYDPRLSFEFMIKD